MTCLTTDRERERGRVGMKRTERRSKRMDRYLDRGGSWEYSGNIMVARLIIVERKGDSKRENNIDGRQNIDREGNGLP